MSGYSPAEFAGPYEYPPSFVEVVVDSDEVTVRFSLEVKDLLRASDNGCDIRLWFTGALMPRVSPARLRRVDPGEHGSAEEHGESTSSSDPSIPSAADSA
jgi:hypothetical protein